MSDKSHVGMGHSVCPVCLERHDEVVLLDKFLRKTLTRGMLMGWDLCPKHKQMFNDGYVALVECSNSSSPTLETANRTGMIAHVRKEVWPNIFNSAPPTTPMAFVESGLIEKLQKLTEGVDDDNG